MVPMYIHIPYCTKKCGYCSFYSVENEGVPDLYIEALTAFIKHYRKLYGAPGTLYIGGGTPSLLTPAQLDSIISAADPAPGAEITLELNPDSTSMRTLGFAKRMGVNRLSIGVQSLTDNNLTVLGRSHDCFRAVDVLEGVQKMGFDNVSMDIMYGIPKQYMEELDFTLDTALELKIPHLSAYCLTAEKGTVLGDSGFKGNEDTDADMYFFICDKLKKAGYRQYEMSNFAKPGYESKHNSVYWTDKDYIGIGPGAHSRVKSRRYAYEPSIDKFLNRFKAQNFEFDYAYRLEEYDRVYEAVMLGLRTDSGMPLSVVEKVVGTSKKAREIADEGYGVIEDGALKLNERGYFIINYLTNELMLEYDLALKEKGYKGL